MRKFTLLFLSTIFSIVGANAQRVLGYFPDYRLESSIQYDKLTDIAFSFANPTPTGAMIKTSTGSAAFSFNSTRFTQVKINAAQNGVDLWLTVGGADDNELRAHRLRDVCNNSTYRNRFITDLVDFGVANSLKGFVIDWEFPKTNAERLGHENLLKDLRAKIDASSRPSMKIDVAVGGETKGSVNHTQFMNASAYQYVDEFHIMAYDFPANNPNYDSQHHSSLNDALGALDGWNSKGVPYDKMLLALPFYGRSTSNRNTAINYNALDGAGNGNSTIYNSDSYGGYKYNGKPTLVSKVNGTFAKGSLGVVVWDIGQDEVGQYSLLTQVYTAAQGNCTAPRPILGADIGSCGTVNETLNSGVSSANGATIAWYKDGNVISGATGLTYTATAKGVYKVVFSKGGCSKEDEIEIVSGSALSATGNSSPTCAGDDISLSVSNAQSGTVYEWYDAANGGSSLGTGSSFTVSPSTTTSYFVEEQSSATTNSGFGKTTFDGLTSAPWLWAQKLGETGHMISVKKSLTLKDLVVYVGGKGTVKVLIFDKFGTALAGKESQEVSFNTGTRPHWEGGDTWQETPVTVPCDISLTPGDYFIVPTGTDDGLTATKTSGGKSVTEGLKVYLENWTDGTNTHSGKPTATATIFGEAVPAYSVTDIIDLDAEAYISWYPNAGPKGQQDVPDYSVGTFDESTLSDWRALPAANRGKYGVIFNLTIVTGAASSCPRAEAVALVKTCEALSVSFNSPSDNQTIDSPDGKEVKVDFDINTTGTVNAVTYTITSSVLANDVIISGSSLDGFDASYTFTENGTYTIKADASDGTDTESASVTITLGKILSTHASFEEAGMSVYPNPTSSNVTIDVDGTVSGEYTLRVSDASGRVVSTTTEKGNTVLGDALTEGVYTVEVITSSNVYVTRVVKQ